MNDHQAHEPHSRSMGRAAPSEEGIPPVADHREDHPSADHSEGKGHRGHGFLMIRCCIPMLVIVGVLAATGAIGFGVIAFAVLCTVMMAIMMVAMPGSHRH